MRSSIWKVVGRIGRFSWQKTHPRLTVLSRYSGPTGSQLLFPFENHISRNLSGDGFAPKPKLKKEEIKMSQTEVELEKDQKALSQYILPLDQPIVSLDCEVAFNNLEPKEKLYAHYLSRACWYGGLAVAAQTSPESPVVIALLLDLFQSNGISGAKEIALNSCSFTEDEWKALVVYASGIFSNTGNYKSFGDTKIIPGVPIDKMDLLIKNSKFRGFSAAEVQEKWVAVRNRVFSLNEREKQLGLGEKGVTTYFSDNCTKDDAELINRFMKSQNRESWMTRVMKTVDGVVPYYEIRYPSALPDSDDTKTYEFEGARIKFTRGDYAPIMEQLCHYLAKAKEYAANENQKKMLEAYVESFRHGSLEQHYEASRFWIKDKSPAIESYIGFIENYRDPDGQRAEFEGFVSVVNRPMSEKFQQLVNRAEHFLTLLPWPAEFEKDTFLRPDYTSLDVLTFSGSGIPAGINIPNYDAIRQNEGFKNVSLGNVIPASYKDSKVPFLSEEDKKLLNDFRVPSFEVQVGLHELLGHGSGKLLKQLEDGTTNFPADLKNPLTKQLIETMYLPGETYDSVFGPLGSTYEECRAEAVGILLSLDEEVLKIFGHEGEEAKTVTYVNWLSMVFAGAAKALEMYQPKTSAWMQAHSQARFVILQVLLEAGQGLVTVEERLGEDGKPDLLITLDKAQIDTVGRKAINDFLLKLQVYKATADVSSARAMYDAYSAVHNDGKYPWARWRDIVMEKKQPRKQFVQHNTVLEGDDVVLKSYEASAEGLIQSWVERFPGDSVYRGLDYCWRKDQPFF